MAAGNSVTALEHRGQLSPELVLVDPELAERARLRLAEPDDTLARLQACIRASLISSGAQRLAEMYRLEDPESRPVRVRSATCPRASRSGHQRRALLAGCLVGGTLVAALLVGIRVDLRGANAGAETTAPAPATSAPTTPPPATTGPVVTTPKVHTTSGRSRPSHDPVPRRFAWAPSPGASGYHVEVFRGSERVFAADAKRPTVVIPESWTFDETSQKLEPGDYRWYVWPVNSAGRAAQAIVRARLVVPPL